MRMFQLLEQCPFKKLNSNSFYMHYYAEVMLENKAEKPGRVWLIHLKERSA